MLREAKVITRLRAMREEKSIDVPAAAKACGIRRQHWNHWERQEARQGWAAMSLRSVEKISRGLGVKVTELVEG